MLPPIPLFISSLNHLKLLHQAYKCIRRFSQCELLTWTYARTAIKPEDSLAQAVEMKIHSTVLTVYNPIQGVEMGHPSALAGRQEDQVRRSLGIDGERRRGSLLVGLF